MNITRLQHICNAKIEDFHSLGQYTECYNGLGYTYIDRGANVLAVAHLDTVQQGTEFNTIRSERNMLIFSPRLDDRLGVYTILEFLPTKGLVFDVLLTEGEESGMSTASQFKTDKKYRWIFEFDRGGSDVVMYQFETSKHRKRLQAAGWEVGYGSYSDIADLEHLACAGFNFGVGYYNYHQPHAYASYNEWFDSVSKFVKFFSKHKDTMFNHTYRPQKRKAYRTYYSRYDSPYSWDTDAGQNAYYEYYIKDGVIRTQKTCPSCKAKFTSKQNVKNIVEHGVCTWCDTYLLSSRAHCDYCDVIYHEPDEVDHIHENGLCMTCHDMLEKMFLDQRAEQAR